MNIAKVIPYVVVWAFAIIMSIIFYCANMPGALALCMTGMIFMVREGIVQALDNTEKVSNDDVLTWGTRYAGIIVDYQDGKGETRRGMPPLDVIIRFNRGTEWYEVQAVSGGYDEKEFPIGAHCEVAISNEQAVVVPGTVYVEQTETKGV